MKASAADIDALRESCRRLLTGTTHAMLIISRPRPGREYSGHLPYAVYWETADEWERKNGEQIRG